VRAAAGSGSGSVRQKLGERAKASKQLGDRGVGGQKSRQAGRQAGRQRTEVEVEVEVCVG
jgi:hypothetical protein